jgi:hypothetical protein
MIALRPESTRNLRANELALCRRSIGHLCTNTTGVLPAVSKLKSVSQLEATEIVHKKSKHLVWVTLVDEVAY